MESSKKESFREFFTWRVLRWILIPTLLLALILSLSLYFLFSSNNEELVVISDNLIDTSHNQDLETHSTFFYRPRDGIDPNDTNSQDFESGELLDLDVSDPPNFLEESKHNSNINTSGEMTFVDRLISTFSQAGSLGQRLTNLGETGIKQQPGIKQIDRNRTKEGTTQGLAVSPTLPSVPPRGHQPTRDPPLNHTESVCRSPSISLCRGVVPWDLTSLPSLPASLPSLDSPSALREALPYFEMVLQSGCSPRAKHFLCPLLEPQCQPYGKQLTPPCRNICRAVAEDCSDFILGTLDLSKVFQCDLYPEPSSISSCVDLTKGSSCLKEEFRCEDGSCIPLRWKCDGKEDCPGASDEATCVKCPAQQFTCGSRDKCIPAAFRCDGHTDCPDSSDEMNCHQPEYDRVMHSHASPCPSGELRCVDGRCISLSQICDGNRDCSDAADESNCRQTPAT